MNIFTLPKKKKKVFTMSGRLNGPLNSFQEFLSRAKDGVAATVSQVTDAISDPKTLPMFLMTFLLPAVLFFVLSPGLLLSLHQGKMRQASSPAHHCHG